MGWSVPLLCAAATTNFLIHSVDGYCQEKKPNDVDFCKKWDNYKEEKNCDLEKCDWVDGPRPNLAALKDKSLITMNQNALSNFDMFKSHISSNYFLTNLYSDAPMSLAIDLEMEYATTAALQLLRAVYYEYFEMYGKSKELLLIDWYILAVGSFGRGELLPCSDLDVIILAIGKNLKEEDGKNTATANAKNFVAKMQEFVEGKVNNAKAKTFGGAAFVFDKFGGQHYADSTDKILEPFLTVNKQSIKNNGNDQSSIVIFGDTQVIYERINNKKIPFSTLKDKWAQKVELSDLNLLFKCNLEEHYTLRQGKRAEYFPKKKDKEKPDPFSSKKGFIRAYSLITYWSYLFAYKYPKYPQFSREPYLMGTVARMNKLAEWGYIQPEVAFWSSYYFHQANIWELRGNAVVTFEKPKKGFGIKKEYKLQYYRHGQAFDFGTHKKFIQSILADNSEAVVGLTAFVKEFKKEIYDVAKKMEKNKGKQKSEPSFSYIAAGKIKVNEKVIGSNLIIHNLMQSQTLEARREYDDYYEDYNFQPFEDEEQYKPSNQQQQQTTQMLYFSIALNMILLSTVFFGIAFISGFGLAYFAQIAQIFKQN